MNNTWLTSMNRPRHLYSPCQVQCRLLCYPIQVIEEQSRKVPHRSMLCRFSADVPWNAKIVSDPSLTASSRGSTFVLLLSLLSITCNKVSIWELCAYEHWDDKWKNDIQSSTWIPSLFISNWQWIDNIPYLQNIMWCDTRFRWHLSSKWSPWRRRQWEEAG